MHIKTEETLKKNSQNPVQSQQLRYNEALKNVFVHPCHDLYELAAFLDQLTVQLQVPSIPINGPLPCSDRPISV